MKVGLSFEKHDLDYELKEDLNKWAEDQIRSALSEQVTFKIRETILSSINDSIKENLNRESIREAMKDTMSDLKDKWSTWAKNYMENNAHKYKTDIDLYFKELSSQRSEILKLFKENSDFPNVSFKFIKLKNKLKGSIEDKAIDYFLHKEIYSCYFKETDIRNGNFTHNEKEYLLDLLNEPRNGRPDLICKKGNYVFFVEVKSENDALRANQAFWIKNHPDFPVEILFIYENTNVEEYDNSY